MTSQPSILVEHGDRKNQTLYYWAYQTKWQCEGSDSECHRDKKDAEDSRAPPARRACAREVPLAKQVVQALVDGPGYAAEQELSLLQLSADVHVGKEKALPVAILLLGDIVLKKIVTLFISDSAFIRTSKAIELELEWFIFHRKNVTFTL